MTRDDVRSLQDDVLALAREALNEPEYVGRSIRELCEALRVLDKIVPIGWGEADDENLIEEVTE